MVICCTYSRLQHFEIKSESNKILTGGSNLGENHKSAKSSKSIINKTLVLSYRLISKRKILVCNDKMSLVVEAYEIRDNRAFSGSPFHEFPAQIYQTRTYQICSHAYGRLYFPTDLLYSALKQETSPSQWQLQEIPTCRSCDQILR